MSAAPHPPGRSPPDWYPSIPPPRPVSLPPGPRGSRSVVLAAARLRALHLDPLRHPTATGQLPRKTTSALDNGPRLHREVFSTDWQHGALFAPMSTGQPLDGPVAA